MKKCKITVLKRHFDEELAKEYGAKNLGKCPLLKDRQIFYADWAKPEGFCDEAWKAIYQYTFALAHGSGVFYSQWGLIPRPLGRLDFVTPAKNGSRPHS